MIEHKLKKGYDIRLDGKTERIIVDGDLPDRFALQPPDFLGLRPRLKVEVGSQVKIGSELFFDKQRPEVKFVSPASGQVTEINRGERRSIVEVVIASDGKDSSEFFDVYDSQKVTSLDRSEIINHLLATGVWPYIRQRPFSKIADPEALPRDIFICAMDTAPLAPDQNLLLQGEEKSFQMGVLILSKLTEGKVYLTINGNTKDIAPALEKVEGVEKHKFSGPHPAGNISVHIFHIAPLNMGDIIWYIYASDVALIGKLFLEGKFPVERIVAVAGTSVKKEVRKYYKTRLGVPVQSLVQDAELDDYHVRYISGNVLNGRRILETGYLGFYSRVLTVIPDARMREFFGWLKPGLKEESFSRLFLSKLIPQREYIKDTRIHGGKRAFIQTGEYEKVIPMDILPTHLVKSIIAEEIEDMIGLGLLEVDEEDFALCTYICPSKIDFGEYIRKGLDILEKEG